MNIVSTFVGDDQFKLALGSHSVELSPNFFKRKNIESPTSCMKLWMRFISDAFDFAIVHRDSNARGIVVKFELPKTFLKCSILIIIPSSLSTFSHKTFP